MFLSGYSGKNFSRDGRPQGLPYDLQRVARQLANAH
jgi:hypothetical protein